MRGSAMQPTCMEMQTDVECARVKLKDTQAENRLAIRHRR